MESRAIREISWSWSFEALWRDDISSITFQILNIIWEWWWFVKFNWSFFWTISLRSNHMISISTFETVVSTLVDIFVYFELILRFEWRLDVGRPIWYRIFLILDESTKNRSIKKYSIKIRLDIVTIRIKRLHIWNLNVDYRIRTDPFSIMTELLKNLQIKKILL